MKKNMSTNAAVEKLRTNIKTSLIVLAALLCIAGAVFSADAINGGEGQTPLQESPTIQMSKEQADVSKIALIAAAIAFAAGALAAGFAISHVGAAAMGAVAEKPEIGGQALIFIALAEGLVVFGFITALMILGKM